MKKHVEGVITNCQYCLHREGYHCTYRGVEVVKWEHIQDMSKIPNWCPLPTVMELKIKRCKFSSTSFLNKRYPYAPPEGLIHCNLLGGVCKAMSIGCYDYVGVDR